MGWECGVICEPGLSGPGGEPAGNQLEPNSARQPWGWVGVDQRFIGPLNQGLGGGG